MDSDDRPDHRTPQLRPPKGKAFEGEVAEFYRALGCKVTTNIRLAGQEIDLLVTRYIEGVGTLTFMVECKDWARPLGNQDVQDFIATVTALRAVGAIQSAVMVSRKGFTPDGKASADPIPYVTLLTPAELEQDVLDATIGMRLLTQDYQEQDIYDDFVAIDGYKKSQESPATGKSDVAIKDVCTVVKNSIIGGRLISFFLLADYGSGKSTLLRRLQYQLCRSNLDKLSPFLPVFVPLKNYYDIQDISILLRNSIRDDFFREVSTQFLWTSIRQGRFVFLLDGFDEMTDRSGEEKRYDLFQRLLPVLISPCPTVLTSRPSLFLAKGEIEDLVSRWQTDTTPLPATGPPPTKQHTKAADRYRSIERLKANLLRRLHADGKSYNDVGMSTGDRLVVINLQPFNIEKIEQYLAQRLAASKAVPGHPVHDVNDTLAFIDRVYDLWDLASRPLLLKLIVDTILEGGIDVTDPTLQFGPSGLYELYTSIKLDVDWEKGPVRRGALTRDQRRQFAETVAVAMHKAGTVEVNLNEVLSALPSDTMISGGVVLSAEEVATDFLTCSFLTIDERQTCRFVHKSFLEFFVARTIKNYLSPNNRLLQGQLPTAILYFLGGFAPTERSVAEQLWITFNKTPEQRNILRRNLLAAYFFTRTHHTARKIRNVEVNDATYGDLTWSRIYVRRCAISTVTIQQFELREPDWADVTLHQCSVGSWKIFNGSVSCEDSASSFGSISLQDGAVMKAILSATRIGSITITASTASVEIRDASIGKLSADRSKISFRMLQSQMGEIDISGSDVNLDGDNLLRGAEPSGDGLIRDSVVRVDGGYKVPKSLLFERCFVQVAQHTLDPLLSQMSSETCVLGIGLVMDAKLVNVARQRPDMDITCGVMGMTYDDPLTALKGFRGWGVLVIEEETAVKELLEAHEFKAVSDRLLICSRAWFTRETATGGELGIVTSILEKDGLVRAESDGSISSDLERLKDEVLELSLKWRKNSKRHRNVRRSAGG